MILQVEMYWLNHAIITVLEEQPFIARRLELLAKRQLQNVERLEAVARDMFNDSQQVLKETERPMTRQLASSRADHASMLARVSTLAKAASERALVLSYAQQDPGIDAKLYALKQEFQGLIEMLSWFGWDCPLRCSVAVDKRGRLVNSPKEEEWQPYPDRVWGCFTASDSTWLARRVRDATGEQQCHYIDPVLMASKLNTPNYFLWAYVQKTCDSEDAYRRASTNLVRAMLAYFTEEDDGNVEDNSPFPSREEWSKVGLELTLGTVLPIMPEKKHESCHDVLASKEAVSNLQMMIMRLTC